MQKHLQHKVKRLRDESHGFGRMHILTSRMAQLIVSYALQIVLQLKEEVARLRK